MPHPLSALQNRINTFLANEMPVSDEHTKEEKEIQAEISELLKSSYDDRTFLSNFEKIKSEITHYKNAIYPEIQDYTYLLTENEISIGLSERKGVRSKQEDYLVAAVKAVEDFDKLSTEAQDNTLKETFDLLQKKYGQRTQVGSTACTSLAWIKQNELHIVTANLGDSAAYLFIVDNNTVTKSLRLNALHNLDAKQNPEEFERASLICRLNNNRPPIADIGLSSDSGLSISRAFGDCEDEAYGLSHEPEIQHYQHHLLPSEKAYIINACDGLMDNKALTLDKISRILTQNSNASLDSLSEHLVTSALKNGSEDNVSLGIAQVHETPLSITILDGHGSHIVSREIGLHFYETLAQRIQFALLNKPVKRPLALSLFSFNANAESPAQKIDSDEKTMVTKCESPNQKRVKFSPLLRQSTSEGSPHLCTPLLKISFSMSEVPFNSLDSAQTDLPYASQQTTETTCTPNTQSETDEAEIIANTQQHPYF